MSKLLKRIEMRNDPLKVDSDIARAIKKVGIYFQNVVVNICKSSKIFIDIMIILIKPITWFKVSIIL